MSGLAVWPLVVRLRVATPGRRRVRLWIPAVLLWPLLLALAVLALVLTTLADLVLRLSGQPSCHATGLLWWSLGALAQCRGMRLSIENRTTCVRVAVH